METQELVSGEVITIGAFFEREIEMSGKPRPLFVMLSNELGYSEAIYFDSPRWLEVKEMRILVNRLTNEISYIPPVGE